MVDEDKVLIHPECEVSSDREVVNGVEEMRIPDYAVLDFGFVDAGRYSLDALYPPRGLLR